MNTRERLVKTLSGQPVDRVPFIPVFWCNSTDHWEKENPGITASYRDDLQFEGKGRGWTRVQANIQASGVPADEIIKDDGYKRTIRRGDGTIMEIVPGKDYSRHTLRYPVESVDEWEHYKNNFLDPDDPDRIPANWKELVATEYTEDREYPLSFYRRGVYGFCRDMLGDENLGYAFYDQPEMVRDMMETYTDMTLAIWGKIVNDVNIDLIEFWEDMASKNASLISPPMFREFMKPQYERVKAFSDDNNISVLLVDSDGFIEGLIPLLLESGINAVYPFEVLAGNDVEKMLEKYPNLTGLGGLDKDVMAKGKDAIDRELEKVDRYLEIGRFIPGQDHGTQSNVNWEGFQYFQQELRKRIVG